MLPRGAVLALALLTLPDQSQADQAPWGLLKSGGQAEGDMIVRTFHGAGFTAAGRIAAPDVVLLRPT